MVNYKEMSCRKQNFGSHAQGQEGHNQGSEAKLQQKIKLDKKVTHLQNLVCLAQGQGHTQGSKVSLRGLRGHLLL